MLYQFISHDLQPVLQTLDTPLTHTSDTCYLLSQDNQFQNSYWQLSNHNITAPVNILLRSSTRCYDLKHLVQTTNPRHTSLPPPPHTLNLFPRPFETDDG